MRKAGTLSAASGNAATGGFAGLMHSSGRKAYGVTADHHYWVKRPAGDDLGQGDDILLAITAVD
jgi:hypothetical protein